MNHVEIFRDYFGLLSLGLTIPTVIAAVAVVMLFWPEARAAMSGSKRIARDWLIMGIAFGFIGQTLDNLYWFVPWTTQFFRLEITSTLIYSGVFFNVFFRQGFGIAAAYCHLRAAQESGSITAERLNHLMSGSLLLGCAYSISLLIIEAIR